MSRRMLAVSSSNHRQRSGGNLADGRAIPGSGLLLTTWENPTLGFRKQERQLRTGSTGGCLRRMTQGTRSGACSYWIALDKCNAQHWKEYKITLMRLLSAPETQLETYMVRKTGTEGRRLKMESIYGTDFSGACVMGKTVGRQKRYIGQGQHSSIRSVLRRHWL